MCIGEGGRVQCTNHSFLVSHFWKESKSISFFVSRFLVRPIREMLRKKTFCRFYFLSAVENNAITSARNRKSKKVNENSKHFSSKLKKIDDIVEIKELRI